MKQAPIVVFSYNRPDHLRKTLESLAQNDLASDSDLFIFCDGAKPNATEEQTRRIYDNRRVAKAASFAYCAFMSSVLIASSRPVP